MAVAAFVVGLAPAALAVPAPAPPPEPTAPSSTTGTATTPKPTTTYARKVASPRRLEIPSLGIDTKIYQVGLDKRRNVVIPEDINKVGWYRLGVPPGVDRGSAVIVGHRDGSGGRKGAFYTLGTMRPGQIVTIQTSSKKALKYRVISTRSILKKGLPYDKYFTVTGKPKLVLISCGGYYDRNNGGYQDNIIVVAEPLFTPIKVAPASG
jgi:LPXTG-site transpeptidase (sortase) family protein